MLNIKSSNRDFNNNPFIEALPRPRDGNVLLNAYTVPIPSLDADDLSKMSVNEQKATVVSLKNLRLPLSFQKQLEFINYDVIVSSLYASQILCLGHKCYWRVNYKKLIKMKGKIEDSAPSGFALLGYSGCGKSSSSSSCSITSRRNHAPSRSWNFDSTDYISGGKLYAKQQLFNLCITDWRSH